MGLDICEHIQYAEFNVAEKGIDISICICAGRHASNLSVDA